MSASSSSEEEEFSFPTEHETAAQAAAAPESAAAAPEEQEFMKQAIPKKKKDKKKKKKDKKKKKKRKKDREKHAEKDGEKSDDGSEHDQHNDVEEQDDADTDSHASNNNDGEEMEVSLNDLKRKVMGRDLKTEEDSDREQDAELQTIRELMNAEPEQEPENEAVATSAKSSNNTSMAEKLRRDLMCSICHEVVYPPVSLLCGHSFCQTCLEWWFDRARTDPSCPTCRKAVPVDRHDAISHNYALKSCVMAVYGSEIVERVKARRTKGERNGQHDAGYEVLSLLEDETWHYIKISKGPGVPTSAGGENTVQVRRSIVLDADDQRMQLALSVYHRPGRIVVDERNCFRVQLCLLSMEEDEAADSGFPTNVENEEDELLLCGRESRFLHTYVEVKMKGENGRTSPVARIASDDNGLFCYVLDPSMSAGDPADARALLFEHTDTGCKLEIDLAQLQSRGGSSLQPQQQPTRGVNLHNDEEDDSDASSNNGRRRGFVMGENDDSEEEEGEDEFEDDGFLVHENSDIEGEFSGEDEDNNDICEVCKKHGELMICDGGDEDEGCGKSFHTACVNLEAVPEGDWICQKCAESHGIATGIEGHEFKPKALFSGSNSGGGPRVLHDDSDDDSGTEDAANQESSPGQPKKKKRRVLEDSDSE